MNRRKGIAADNFRETPHYRRDCFREGLHRLGFRVGFQPQKSVNSDDLLLIWNRNRYMDPVATMYEKAGATVVVAENGYIGQDPQGRQLYAIALSNHAGAGSWSVGSDDRWSRLGVSCKPWRRDGGKIVLLPQRGIGNPKYAMPKDWVRDVTARLRKVTDRPIVVREHPGKERSSPMPDLEGAWAAVTWASGAGIKAIIGGIPVFHEMGKWIGAPAAKSDIRDIENPFLGDRMPMLRRLAYAQWTLREIQTGEAFECLLQKQ